MSSFHCAFARTQKQWCKLSCCWRVLRQSHRVMYKPQGHLHYRNGIPALYPCRQIRRAVCSRFLWHCRGLRGQLISRRHGAFLANRVHHACYRAMLAVSGVAAVPSMPTEGLFGYKAPPCSGIPNREVIRWVQGLDLTLSVTNFRRCVRDRGSSHRPIPDLY